MSSTTVAEFANELKKSTATLLEQLKAAGVAKSSPADRLTDADKHSLLNYLQSAHGTASAERKKITLVKKSTSEIKQADSSGKARTIQVEVRKKRTFVRREDGTDGPLEAPSAPEPVEPPPPAAPAIDHAELARREEEARRQAELIRRQEEELAQKRLERQEQEARARAAAEAAAQAEAEAAARAKAAAVADSAPAAKAAEAAAEQKADQDRVAAKQKVAAESKARADEEAARAADLSERRRKAVAEVAKLAKKGHIVSPVVVQGRAIASTAWGKVSPALKVFSTTLPLWTALSLVRTKAEPLPGLTCRNSTTRQTWPSSSIEVPVRKSLLEIIPAERLRRIVRLCQSPFRGRP